MGIFAGTPWDIPVRCDRCQQLERECRCPPLPPPPPERIPPQQQTACLTTENRKRGKTVTLVTGLPAMGNDLPELLTQLKTACGAGGTLKDETIELQGQHLDRVRTLLASLGYKTKG